jgi:WD40 repeat protein
LAVGGSDGPIDIWDLSTRQVLHRLPGHTNAVHALLYSPNPAVLASASGDGTLRFWEAGSGSESYKKKLEDRLKTLAFSANGRLLATAGDGRVVTIFSMDSWTAGITLQGHPLTVRSVAFSPDQQTLATGCDDAKVRLWDLTTGQLFYALRGHTDRVNAVTFSPDGRILASCDHKGVIRIWRAEEPAKIPRVTIQ